MLARNSTQPVMFPTKGERKASQDIVTYAPNIICSSNADPSAASAWKRTTFIVTSAAENTLRRVHVWRLGMRRRDDYC